MSGELVPTTDNLQLVSEQQRGQDITAWLGEARHALTEALAASDPDQVRSIRAQVGAVAEATRQLDLSKEIQLDAVEMVRRAERAVGQVIRRGQANGTVIAPGDNRHTLELGDTKFKIPVTSLASYSQLTGTKGQPGLYDLTDDVSDDQFDQAITEARTEENLSRANIVRKINNTPAAKLTGAARLSRIAERAAEGAHSTQIASELGHSPEFIRKLARANGIPLPADRVTRGGRRLDHREVLESATITLTACVDSLQLLDVTQLDPDGLGPWVSALGEAVTSLDHLWKKIRKELDHGPTKV